MTIARPMSRQWLPAWRNHAALVALLGFLVILSGNFKLPDSAPLLAGIEVRWILLTLTLFFWLIWRAGVRSMFPSGGGRYCLYLWTTVSLLMFSAILNGSALTMGLVLDFLFTGLAIGATVSVIRVHTGLLNFLFPALVFLGYIYSLAALVAGPGAQDRYAAFGGGPNVFGRIVGFSIIALVALAVQRKRYRYLGAAPILMFFLVLSGSRGAMLATAVALCVVLPYFLTSISLLKRIGFCGLGVIVVFLTILFAPESVVELFEQRIVVRTVEMQYDSGRSRLYAVAISMFFDNPLIGSGVGGYFAEFGVTNDSGNVYAHNIVLQLLAEVGILGCLIVMLPIVAILITWCVSRVASVQSTGIAGLALLILVSSLFSGGYYDFRYCWLFIGLLYISLWRDRRASSSSERLSRSGTSD